MDGGEEGRGVFGVPGGDASPTLEIQERILDEMPGFVEILVVFPHHLTVLFRRDHWLHALRFRLFDNGISIVSFIRQKAIRRDSLNQL